MTFYNMETGMYERECRECGNPIGADYIEPLCVLCEEEKEYEAEKKRGMNQPHFDTRALIRHFGGPAQAVMLLDLYGFNPPSQKGVEKWVERSKIDSHRLAQFAHIAAAEGRPINLSEFVVAPEEETHETETR